MKKLEYERDNCIEKSNVNDKTTRMRKVILCAALLICVMVCAIFFSCGKKGQSKNKNNKYNTYSFDYFDTVTVITGYEESQAKFDEVSKKILDQLAEYHKLYSIYHRFENMENMCTINELVDGAHRTVTVDRKIIDMLLYAKEMYKTTNGMVNVAMGSVLSLWHDYRTIGMDNPSEAALPPMDKLIEAAKHTDINKMIIDEVNCTVTLTDPLMKLDVGAVAKGYAVEQIARFLESENVTGYVLNVGGNVRTIGSKPNGEGWVIGIENPDASSSDYLAYLELSSQTLVTSGSYQRYYIVDGKKYHHIIHPDTNMPSEGFVSVSVLCKDSGQADALSTALFCMTLEEGKNLVESLDGVEALWVDDSGKQTTSTGWSKYEKNMK